MKIKEKPEHNPFVVMFRIRNDNELLLQKLNNLHNIYNDRIGQWV